MTDLPPGWEWVTLAEIADIGGGIQKHGRRTPVENKYPFLRVANVLRGRLDLRDVHEIELFPGELDRFILQRGDLLVVEGNGSPDHLGRGAVWGGQIPDCVHQNHLIRVRPSGDLLPDYLGLVWNSPAIRSQLLELANSTSGLYTLSKAKLARVRIPLAPLAEQRRIVAVLEEIEARLAAADRSINLIVNRSTNLEKSARDYFVGGRNTSAEGWRVGSLAEVLVGIDAGRSFSCEPRPATAEEWGVIKVSAMTWGRFRQEENKAVPDGHGVDQRHEIRTGDILVSRANTMEYVGAPVRVVNCRPRLLLSDKSLRLTPRPEVDPDWLLQVLASSGVRRQVSARATGTKESMRNISQKSLLEVSIPIPPVAERAVVAVRLKEFIAQLDRTRDEIEAARRRSIHLRKVLLAEAFAGRLVVQDAADESASVLLERIRAERASTVTAPRRRRRVSPAQEGKRSTAPRSTSRPVGEWASVTAGASAPMLPLEDAADHGQEGAVGRGDVTDAAVEVENDDNDEDVLL